MPNKDLSNPKETDRLILKQIPELQNDNNGTTGRGNYENSPQNENLQTDTTLIDIETDETQTIGTGNSLQDEFSPSLYKIYILKRFLLCGLIYLIVFALVMTRNYWYIETEEDKLEESFYSQ